MGAVVFPSNPNINDIHNHEGISWIWDGSSWSKLFKSWSFSDQNDYLYYNTDNVGIGTTSPSVKLDVEVNDNTPYSESSSNPVLQIGNINTSANTNFSSLQLFTDGDGRGLVNLNALSNSTSSSADFSIQTRHNATIAERMRILSDGRVGIGTENPTSTLHINEKTNGQTAEIILSSADPEITPEGFIVNRLSFRQEDVSGGGAATGITGAIGMRSAKLLTNTTFYGVSADMGFFVSGHSAGAASDNASLEAMTIQRGTGNVGIGITDPSAPLHAVVPSTSAGGTYVGVFENLSSEDGSQHGVKIIVEPNGGYPLAISNDSGATNNCFSILNNGRVGIGTASPISKLHVSGPNTNIVSGLISSTDVDLSMIAYQSSHAEIRVGTDHDLLFKTNGNNERMRITNDGKVSFGGIASPTDRFEIEVDTDEALRIVNTAGTMRGYFGRKVSGEGHLGIFDASSNERIHLDTTAHSFFTGSGNVGIGTSSPAEKLEVSGAIKLGTTSSTNPGTIRYNTTTNDFEGYDGASWNSLTTGGSTSQWTTSSNDIYYNTGNVGIGTTSPQTKLHISHGETSVFGPQEVLRLQGDWNGATGVDGDGAFIRFTNQHNNGLNPNTDEYNVAGIAGLDNTSAWGGSLYFYTASAGGNSTAGGNNLETRMVIDSSGNVGIGTSSNPSGYRLDVTGGRAIVRGSTEGVLVLDDSGVSDGSRPIQYISSDGGYLKLGNANRSSTNATTNSVNRLTIDSSGNVEIGTSSTSVDLKVNDHKVFHEGTEIPGHVDLNDYRTTGFYVQTANADTTSSGAANWPVNKAGILQVLNYEDGGTGTPHHTSQMYHQYATSNVWTRYYYDSGSGGAWTGWVNLNDDADFSSYLPLTGGTISGNLSVDGSAGIYTNGWFRNNHSDEGLYNEANGNHFYSSTSQYWHMTAKSDQTFGGLVFYKGHNDGTTPATNRKGSVYWSDAGFGLLDNDGSWAFRTVGNEAQLFYDGSEKLNTTSTGVNITGNLSVSGGFQGSFQNNPTVTTTSGYEAPGSEISHVVAPSGASIRGNSSETGAIKITLPHSWTNTMLYIKVRIYEYDDAGPGQSGQNVLYGNNSVEVHAAGYNNDGGGGTWVQTTAFTHKSGMSMKNVDYNVRFGHDGSKCCIYIGDSDTDWVYPQVAVIDGTFGYVGYDTEDWSTGWDVSFTTSIQNVGATIFTGKRVNFFKDLTIRTQGVNGTSVYGPSGTSPLNYTVANFADFKDSPYRYYEKIEVYSQNGLETILIDDLISANPTASTVFRIRYDDDELADDQMYFYFSGDDLILKQSSAPANTQYKIYRIDVVKD